VSFRKDPDGWRLSLDLAAHLQAISTPPSCGSRWTVQTAIAIAEGDALGGDFMVFTKTGDRLQAVVVDASGKGFDAATRSVMLAGAISGLLGELRSEMLFSAVNRHVLRLDWDEHFATAVHLDLSLDSGEFLLAVAGHPSPVAFDAGAGKWRSYAETGPALGLVPEVTWGQHEGRLQPGDALVVVTDGVIELPGEDLDLGLDRMLGHAERLVLTQFEHGAETLLDRRPRPGRDDAQVLLLHRRAT
jgi:serine phosphatase RsbU (regulator of sigma subunit)